MIVILSLVALLTTCREAVAVRFQYLGVPGSVLLGQSVWLNCGYDLQEDELYSVKWYKNNYEFYRYLPSEHPPSQMYNLEGIFMDLRISNSTHVHLTAADLLTEGIYACEVSTDAPSFRTVRADKQLRVYVLPEADPFVVGIPNRYFIGDQINATCFFGPSKPPADLTWYINGDTVSNSRISYEQLDYDEDTDVANVESHLVFEVDRSHVANGAINVECMASVWHVFSKSSEEIVVGESSSGIDFQKTVEAAPGEDAPIITGSKNSYEVSQIVDLNCSSPRSVQTAELHWKINDESADLNFLIERRPIIYSDGKVSVELGLLFRLQAHHFKMEEVRIKCIATLSKVIEKRTVETIYTTVSGSSGMFHLSSKAHPDYRHWSIRWPILLILLEFY